MSELDLYELYRFSCEEYYNTYSPSYEGGEKFDDFEKNCYNYDTLKEEIDYEGLY